MFKSKKSRRQPSTNVTSEMRKHWEWCVSNGISFHLKPNCETAEKWNIEITIGNKKSQDPTNYIGKEAADKLYEYSKYYYDKHHKNENKI